MGYFVDGEGSFLFGKQFDAVTPFTGGLACVKKEGKWGFINPKGEVVIPCIYDGVNSFSKVFAN